MKKFFTFILIIGILVGGYFGVKKGTYYIAVKNTDKYYGMKATFSSVKENSGASKKHHSPIWIDWREGRFLNSREW